jgi:putative Mn2+ efflux pump MntP
MTYSQLVFFLLIGIGLSFDSFAVSVSCGLVKKQIKFREAVPIALSLAFFQAVFPVLGWFAGIRLQEYIAAFDHWVAFILLAYIGIRMIFESKRLEGHSNPIKSLSLRVVMVLSVATSIDALVVGISFGVLDISIIYPVIIIGVVTFLASMLGMLFGKKISLKYTRYSCLAGGFVLVAMGLKILIEHTWPL